MNWTHFLTYGDSKQEAFETLCTQLFERFLRRKYGTDLVKFRVVNGAGGDGGVEAYGELRSGDALLFSRLYLTANQLRRFVFAGEHVQK